MSVTDRTLQRNTGPPEGGFALVVDDQRMLAEALAERLALEGFAATLATTATEALQRCGERAHDVAFIDLTLPDMSGLVVAAELKRRSPDSMVVLMTGFATSVEDRLWGAGQYDALLPKPWKSAELNAILGVLRSRRQ